MDNSAIRGMLRRDPAEFWRKFNSRPQVISKTATKEDWSSYFASLLNSTSGTEELQAELDRHEDNHVFVNFVVDDLPSGNEYVHVAVQPQCESSLFEREFSEEEVI